MPNSLRKETLAGLVGPVIGLGFVLLAIALAPEFTWEDNALSDLGRWFNTDLGPNPFLRAAIFNAGLIAGGLLIVYFTLSLIRQIRDIVVRLTLLSFVVTGIFLTGVGIFPGNIKFPHGLTALGFFLSLPPALALTGLGLLRPQSTRIGGAVLILLAILSVVLFRPWTTFAIWEYTMAMVGTSGVIIIGILDATEKLEPLKTS